MTSTTAVRVQISTSVSHHKVSGATRITAVVRTGEHKGRRATVPYNYGAIDPHVVAVVVLTSKLDMFGAIEYAGTMNNGGSTYNIAV